MTCAQARVVRAPEGAPASRLEVVALRDVGAGVRHQLAQLGHGSATLPRLAAALGEIGLVAGDAGKGRRPLGGDDREREGVEAAGLVAVSRAAATSSAGAPASPLLKCRATPPVPRAGEQRIGELARGRPRAARPAARRTDSRAEPAGLAGRRPEDVAGGAPGRSSATTQSGAFAFRQRGVPEVRAPGSATISGGYDRMKSAGRLADPVEERLPDCLAPARWSRPWNTMVISQRRCPGRNAICSPQCGLNRPRVEVHESPIRPRNAASELAWTVAEGRAENSGSACVRSVSRVTTPRLPPPPPFNPQNRSGLVQALAMRTAPSAVTISASSRLAAASAVVLREAAEAAALDQAGDADGQAAAALHVAARLG